MQSPYFFIQKLHEKWRGEIAVWDKVTTNEDFVRDKHISFFKQCLTALPAGHMAADTSRFFIY